MAESKYHFERFTPIDNMDLDVYKDAIDYVFDNSDVKNVAISGAYGAGKSSIINSYLKSHADAQQKSLRISMATFIESKTEGSDSSHSLSLIHISEPTRP